MRHYSFFIIHIQLHFTMQWMRKCSFYWSIRLCMHNDIIHWYQQRQKYFSCVTTNRMFSISEKLQECISKHFLLKCRTFLLWVPAPNIYSIASALLMNTNYRYSPDQNIITVLKLFCLNFIVYPYSSEWMDDHEDQ